MSMNNDRLLTIVCLCDIIPLLTIAQKDLSGSDPSKLG
jgi:hypothetical protein